MVARQPFGDLVPGDAFDAVVGSDHSGPFQNGQRPVDGGNRDLAPQFRMELGGRPRPVGTIQGGHDLTPASGVSDPRIPEPLLHLSVLD